MRKHNQELYQAKLYEGQKTYNPVKANCCYLFLWADSQTLYRKQALSFGVDLSKPPAENIDNWLNSAASLYRPELASSIFFYQGWANRQDQFILCLQTQEMKTAAWEYAHQKQLILDGTFRICDQRVLLFTALGVNKQN